MPLNYNKDLKMYYSISEVASMFGVTETLLRYWEKEFPSLKPHKSGRNIRQYTASDIEEIRLIHNLVKVRGMRLASARKTLSESHGKATSGTKLYERLQAIRAELVSIRKELDNAPV